ncbi:diacylglycerol kinase family protein [Patescibacteria group bacterium]|nr:diacylglycerol kinase family protein [Patescibacteria group bacterium]
MAKGQLIKSFVNAFKGIKTVFKEEQNFRIQIFIAILVVILMNIFTLSIAEKSVLILLILSVLVLELFNSILERLVDVFKPRVHSYIKDIKDIAAGAVLLSSVGAVFVAIVIFYPHIESLIFKLLRI